jgi:2-alkyl-3-oxoalkanoate reductase
MAAITRTPRHMWVEQGLRALAASGPDAVRERARAVRRDGCHGFGWCLVFREEHHAKGKAMRVFVTGATGALGRHLVPGLVAAGHAVTATTRTPAKTALLREAGAEPVVVDGLDRQAVIAAVRAAAPEVIVHEMTALAGMRSFRNPDKLFAVTNELRTRGTDNLLAAAAEAGTRRVVAQSYAGAGPDERPGPVKTEEDPADWRPVPSAMQGPAAIAHVETTVPAQAQEGLVLRYGGFYGPGTGDFLVEAVRKRQVPVIGGGTGIWSFVEITDAAAATVTAVGRGAPGIYNVVDDDPAPVAEWLPYLAEVLGAKPPLRIPAWLGRLLAGEFVVAQMTSSRGYLNEKAKKELDWEPRYASWREGFRAWVGG